MKSMLIGAVLATSTLAAHAAELTLFGQQLNAVSRESLKQAAKDSGARLTSSSEGKDVFDASQLGLPGASTLEVVYLQDKVVMAQYLFPSGMPEVDERFRKMLVSKYGKPASVDNDFTGTPVSQFAGQYVGDGKYSWRFNGGMDLVYTHEFFGQRYLTYVNRSAQAKMQHLLDAASKHGADKAAKAKQDLF
jgi:hypothetical protein